MIDEKVSLVVVPGLFSHPFEADACLRADLDGGRLGSCHGLLHRLHQVLRVPHQHLRRLNVLVRACSGKVVQRLLLTEREMSHPVLRALLPSLLRGFSAGSRWLGCARTLEAGSEE